MREAPVVVLVLNTNGTSPFLPVDADARITELCNTLSIGAAVQNLLLRAFELRLGTLLIANTSFAYPELTAHISTDAQLVCAVALRLAAESPAARPWKPLADIAEFRL